MKIKANGIDINYRVDGPDNAPCLVFSNSLATTLAMWDEQASALKNKFRVLRYDQRGHGGTDAPAGRYAFDTLLADAVGFSMPCRSRRRISPACRWAERPRSASPKASRTFGRIIVATRLASRRRRAASNGKNALRSPRARASKLWSSRPSHAGSRPILSQRTRPISRRCAAMIRNTPVNGFIGCAAALAAHDYASTVATVKLRCCLWSVIRTARHRPPCASSTRSFQVRSSSSSGRRSYLQYGPASGIHPRHCDFLSWPPDKLSVK